MEKPEMHTKFNRKPEYMRQLGRFRSRRKKVLQWILKKQDARHGMI
jgi:hypothetical protein